MTSRQGGGLNRLVVPLTSLALGGLFLIVGLAAGDTALGIGGMSIMVCYAAFLLIASRSETMSILHGQPVDERYQNFAVNALAFSGLVSPLLLCGIGIIELAMGADGQPYALICLMSVAIFVIALLWQKWRS